MAEALEKVRQELRQELRHALAETRQELRQELAEARQAWRADLEAIEARSAARFQTREEVGAAGPLPDLVGKGAHCVLAAPGKAAAAAAAAQQPRCPYQA